MTYRLDNRYQGYPLIEDVVPVPASLPAIPISPGFIAIAEDPVWGPGEFVFARAGATIRLQGLCTLLPVWDGTNKVYTYNATEAPAAATTFIGRPLYVSKARPGNSGVNSLTVGQYGWFQMSGRSVINGSATVAADTALGRTNAGQVGANAASVQLLNARVITPATNTVVAAAVSGVAGEFRINLVSNAGFFEGGYVSGTGVGAAAIVTFVDPQGTFISVSVANSAAVTGNVTQTANNATIFYNVVEMNRLFGQGTIT